MKVTLLHTPALVMRAGVVLDLVPDGWAEAFVNSLCNFFSKRGWPQIILSDNGSPYIVDATQ